MHWVRVYTRTHIHTAVVQELEHRAQQVVGINGLYLATPSAPANFSVLVCEPHLISQLSQKPQSSHREYVKSMALFHHLCVHTCACEHLQRPAEEAR